MGKPRTSWKKLRSGARIKTKTTYIPPPKKRSKNGTCLPLSALVLTPTGWLPIDSMNAGDLIISFSQTLMCVVVRPITKRIDFPSDRLWEIRTEQHHEPLRATGSHTFLCQDEWKRVNELTEGDLLLRVIEGKQVEVKVLSVTQTNTFEPVCNLHTASDHNFIVGGGFIAHNFSYFRSLRSFWQRLFCDEVLPETIKPKAELTTKFSDLSN